MRLRGQGLALALGLTLSLLLAGCEAAFLALFRQGLAQKAWTVMPVMLALGAVRFPLQAALARLEAVRAAAAARAGRLRVQSLLRRHQVSAVERSLDATLPVLLSSTLPKAVEGWLAGRQALGAALQLAVLLPVGLWAAPQMAWLFLLLAPPAYAMAKWKGRSLRRHAAEVSREIAATEEGQASWTEGLESLLANGDFQRTMVRDAEQFARQGKAEGRWRLAQQVFPAWLELFFFAALSLLAWWAAHSGKSARNGVTGLEDWIVLGGALILAYRPLRELGRAWPLWLAGRNLALQIETILARWRERPRRRRPALSARASLDLADIGFAYPGGPNLWDRWSAAFPLHGVTGLVGPNGAGKTTLLRLLAGLEIPHGGAVLWPEALRKAGHAAYLPQRLWLPHDMPARLAGLAEQSPARFKAYEALLGVAALRRRPLWNIRELSGGERQRLGLLMTLMSDSPFLLLDEPTSFLPGDVRAELLGQLLDQWRHSDGENAPRRGAVVVAHEPFLSALCDSVITLPASRG